MIAALPPDPALPALPVLFDEPTLTGLVSEALREGDARASDIAGFLPVYVRYKPGTNCLVQYELAFRDSAGVRRTVTAQIKIFTDDRAARRSGNRKMGHLIEQTGEETFPRKAVYLPAIDGLLQIYPLDYDLRALARIATRETATAWLRGGMAGYDGPTVMAEPELIRYKPERKALVRYELAGGPVDQIYVKAGSDGRSRLIAGSTERLIAAGLPTPRVLAVWPEQDVIAHEAAPGHQLASLRDTDEYAGLMEPLAGLLKHLHQTPLPDLPAHRLADEAALMVQTAGWLASIAPSLTGRLSILSGRIAERLGELDDLLVTSHGDFYDDQALVSPEGMILLDLDELRLSHPLHDVGNMLAHLTAAPLKGQNPGAARETFLCAALAQREFSEQDMAVFEAAALLKLAPGPFRRLEPDWPEGIERIVGLAEGVLERQHRTEVRCYPPERPSRATDGEGPSVVDPSLPTLGALQDRAEMSRHLALTLGERDLSVAALELVRHKPGRRVIVRYEVERRTGREIVFGKSFASERGPRVAAITRQITEAKAFGPEVALPDLIAWLPDLRLLVQRAVPGEPVESALLAGDVALAERIADALHAFHASGLDLGRSHDLEAELKPLAVRAGQVGAACPDLATLSRFCLDTIEAKRDHGWIWRSRPVHRDFYDAQLLLDGDRLAVLDLDDAAMSEPAVDIANFTVHLMLLQARHPARTGELVQTIDAFLERSLRRDPDLEPALVQFLTATTLLRLAGIHVGRDRGHEIARSLLESCAVLLEPGETVRRSA